MEIYAPSRDLFRVFRAPLVFRLSAAAGGPLLLGLEFDALALDLQAWALERLASASSLMSAALLNGPARRRFPLSVPVVVQNALPVPMRVGSTAGHQGGSAFAARRRIVEIGCGISLKWGIDPTGPGGRFPR